MEWGPAHHKGVIRESNCYPSGQVYFCRHSKVDEISSDCPSGVIVTHSLCVAAGVEPASTGTRIEFNCPVCVCRGEGEGEGKRGRGEERGRSRREGEREVGGEEERGWGEEGVGRWKEERMIEGMDEREPTQISTF